MLDIQEIAALLEGDADLENGKVRCPSPNGGELIVKIYDDDIFVYYGGRAADAYVRERLGLPPRKASGASLDTICRIWLKANELTPCCFTVKYLESRGITIRPNSIRHHHQLWHDKARSYFPAMVAERLNICGDMPSIHRTFLGSDPQTWKVCKADTEGHPQKMDLGQTRGTAIRLAPAAEEMLVGEGIETVLSAMQMTGLPGWAAGSANALRTLVLPEKARRVIILVDGDEPGERAANVASCRWTFEGRHVRLARAPAGKDFNDLLLEGVL